MNNKRIFFTLIMILCFYVIAIQMVSIGKTEVLTVIYGKEFDEILLNGKMSNGAYKGTITKIDYMKVLDYSYDKATIYCVNRCDSGNVCTYVKNQDDCWTETKWKTVWSVSGSDSDMIWPYWWDTILNCGL